MKNVTNFKHLSLAALFAFTALSAVSMSGAAFADGTHSDGHGGAVCKGFGHCLVLEIECKGTYTDATDSNGTVYGKCSKTAQIGPGFQIKNRIGPKFQAKSPIRRKFQVKSPTGGINVRVQKPIGPKARKLPNRSRKSRLTR